MDLGIPANTKQWVKFKDIKEYPILYREAIDYLKTSYTLHDNVDDLFITTSMKNWYDHKFTRQFWSLVSKGHFEEVQEKFSYLSYLFDKQPYIQTLNNGLWKS